MKAIAIPVFSKKRLKRRVSKYQAYMNAWHFIK